MSTAKLKSLMKSWTEVKEKIEDVIKDKNFDAHKEKVIHFVDKAKEELTNVVENDIVPLIKEGKKEIGKLQSKLEDIYCEKKKPQKKTAAKKTAKKKAPKKSA